MDVKDIKIDDELKNLLPPLSFDELLGLEEDIKKHGVLDPIIVWNGFIADGHNRYSICRKLGIESVDTKELHKDSKAEVMEWIIDHQFARRNIKKTEQIYALEKLRKKKEEEKKTRSLANLKRGTKKVSDGENFPHRENGKTYDILGAKIGVSGKTYRNQRLVALEGTEEQKRRMDKGGKGNGVSAIANEIRDRKDGVPNGFRKCTKCGEVKPLSEFGKGNARHCVQCVSKSKISGVIKTKKCRNCGLIKPISEFYSGRNYCKLCHDSHKSDKDVKGNILKINPELRGVTKKEILGDTYNADKKVEFGVYDLINEIDVNSKQFLWSLDNTFDIHPGAMSGGRDVKLVLNALDEIIEAIQKIKEKIHGRV